MSSVPAARQHSQRGTLHDCYILTVCVSVCVVYCTYSTGGFAPARRTRTERCDDEREEKAHHRTVHRKHLLSHLSLPSTHLHNLNDNHGRAGGG